MALDPYKGKIRCPQCSYPLLGLPPVHSCPECGLNYDPYSRIYNISRGRFARYTVIVVGVLSVVAVIFVFSGGLRWHALPILFPCIFNFVLALNASRVSVKRVFIDRFGIQFEHPSLPAAFVPWTQFGHARLSWATGRIRIFDRTGRSLAWLSRYQVRPRTLAHSCVTKMNELAAIYASVDLNQ